MTTYDATNDEKVVLVLFSVFDIFSRYNLEMHNSNKMCVNLYHDKKFSETISYWNIKLLNYDKYAILEQDKTQPKLAWQWTISWMACLLGWYIVLRIAVYLCFTCWKSPYKCSYNIPHHGNFPNTLVSISQLWNEWGHFLACALFSKQPSPDILLAFEVCVNITLSKQTYLPYMWLLIMALMMTSSNGTIFRVTGPLCGEFTNPGEFPAQRPMMRSFDVFFDLRLNKRVNKRESGDLRCHCGHYDVNVMFVAGQTVMKPGSCFSVKFVCPGIRIPIVIRKSKDHLYGKWKVQTTHYNGYETVSFLLWEFLFW